MRSVPGEECATCAAMLANLTATQERCNTLLEEARAARADAANARTFIDAMSAVLVEQHRALVAAHEFLQDLRSKALAAQGGPDGSN